MPDARIEEDFAELQYAAEVIEAQRLRLLGEIDRRGIFSRDGHLSAASWLASRFKVAWSAACAQVRTARALTKMPLTREALAKGEISSFAVRALVGLGERTRKPSDGGWTPRVQEVGRIGAGRTGASGVGGLARTVG